LLLVFVPSVSAQTASTGLFFIIFLYAVSFLTLFVSQCVGYLAFDQQFSYSYLWFMLEWGI